MSRIFLILFLTTSFFSFSQENDTTFVKLGKTKFIIINDDDTLKTENQEFRGHLVGLSFGINTLNTNSSTTINDGNITNEVLKLDQYRSWELNLDFYQYSLNLYKEHFGLVTGLGFKFSNYRFLNKYRITNYNDSLYATTDTINNYYKTKLNIAKIRIPLVFEWQNEVGRKNRIIYFSAGGFVSYNISSSMKYNYRINGRKIKEKLYDNFQLNPFQYGLIARFAYGHFEIYAEYNLSEMFNTNKAMPTNQAAIGFVILDF